jgi:peptide/nickel transport system permease protein
MKRGGTGRWKTLAVRMFFILLNVLIVLLLIASINFAIFRTYSEETWLIPRITGEYRYFVMEDLGLNDSLIAQYLDYLINTLTGHFYQSTGAHKFTEIESFIYDYASRTVFLLAIASIASIILGLLWGSYSGRNASRPSGKLAHVLAVVAFAVPVSQLSLTLSWADFAANLGLAWTESDSGGNVIEALRQVILPTASLTVLGSGYFALVTRAGVLRAARLGRETSPLRSLDYVNPFPYLLMPLLVAGIFYVEPAFGYEGLGFLVLRSIALFDIPATMACFFLISVIVYFSQLIFRAVRERTRFMQSIDAALKPCEPVGGFHIRYPESTGTDRPFFSSITPRCRELARAYLKRSSGKLALIILLAILLCGLFADVLSTVPQPWAPEGRELNVIEDGEVVWMNPLPPSLSSSPYSGMIHPLGTDYIGRDLYSMNLYAAGNGLIVVMLTVAISVSLGLLVGYIGILSANFTGLSSKLGRRSVAIVGQTLLAIPGILILVSVLASPYGWGLWDDSHSVLVESSLVIFLLMVSIYCWTYGEVTATPPGLSMLNEGRRGWRRMRAAISYSTRFFACNSALVLSRVLRVTKYSVILVFLFASIASMRIGPMPEIFDFASTWNQMLTDARSYGLFADQYWWWIAVPVAGTLLLVVSSYFFLGTLERVLMERTQTTASHGVAEERSGRAPAEGERLEPEGGPESPGSGDGVPG